MRIIKIEGDLDELHPTGKVTENYNICHHCIEVVDVLLMSYNFWRLVSVGHSRQSVAVFLTLSLPWAT